MELLNLMGCMGPKATSFKSNFVKAGNPQCKSALNPQILLLVPDMFLT